MPTTRNQALRAEFHNLFDGAKMPSSPALAARLLELVNQPNSSAADFGEVIRVDPALSTRLLRTANSALFAQRNPVATIERAITVLGLNRVKTISLGFQLVAHLDRLGGVPFEIRTFWQHSLLRACLARAVAQRVVPQREEEAFLVGLLQDCGVLMLVQVLGSSYAGLYGSKLSPTAFYTAEKASFPHTHVEAISALAHLWNLPEVITVPLEKHHHPVTLEKEASDVDRLSAVSYFVGGLRFTGDVALDPDEQKVRDFGAMVLGLDQAAWSQVQQWADDEYKRTSALYGEMLADEIDVADLLSEANRQLACVAHDADRRVLDVEAQRDAIHQEQRGLADALRTYRERAAFDPLTNVLNRGALAEVMRKAIQKNLDQGAPIGVLFLDLDDFKQLNDTHGHKVGDNVLKAVADLLAREIQHPGNVGRYGGEEFVAILPGASLEETHEFADRIVRLVGALDAHACGASTRTTCSVGAVWCARVTEDSAEGLVARADELMYQAKRRGKNRCCFESSAKTDLSACPDGRGKDAAAHVHRETCRSAEVGTDGEALDELLALADELNSADAGVCVGIRKQERAQLVAPCVLHCFTGIGAAMRAEDAATRNISTGGMGLLVARPMIRGEAVEVVLDNGDSSIFLAGLVAFCRHIRATTYEVGVQFVTHAVTPIISGKTSQALQQHEWVGRALSVRQACQP